MMDLEPFLEASQNRNSVFYSRLVYENLLESSFESSVLFDIFSVFIESRSTDTVEFPSCQLRLEKVSGIHGTFSLTGSYYIVYLVYEQDYPAF